MLNIYIGYDPRESVAFHVLAHSLLRRSSVPLSVSPLVRSQLSSIYTRPRGPIESTEFSMTRFLVPYLSGYAGWSLYMDCDMLCRTDIAALAAEIERHADKAVVVCKHDYVPKSERKFLDQVQTKYARKNWSSLMLFNNRALPSAQPGLRQLGLRARAAPVRLDRGSTDRQAATRVELAGRRVSAQPGCTDRALYARRSLFPRIPRVRLC